MNNPMMMIMNAARMGQDPMQAIQALAGSNPMMAQGLRMIQGKSPEQLKQMAQNMAQQRGLNAEDMARQIMGGPTN